MMPNAIKRHKLPTLQPRLKELQPRIKVLGSKTLKEKQQANGRTLALNGAAWRRLRALVLSRDPLCRECMRDDGRAVPATDVDHHDNDPSNNDLLNLVSLCHFHHSRKTAREMGGSVRMGCDAHGMPLDPCHVWNAAVRAERSPATEAGEPGCTLHAHRRS